MELCRDHLTTIQLTAHDWLVSQPDYVCCEHHGANQRLTDCARRIRAFDHHNGHPMNKYQRRLRRVWAGCDGCPHAVKAQKLIPSLPSITMSGKVRLPGNNPDVR